MAAKIGTSWGGEIDKIEDTKDVRLLELGGERIYSGFLQVKHRFNDAWILNSVFRYDIKDREDQSYEKLSPRLALIYLPDQTWEYKVSYSESFVDGPYWYRKNQGLNAFGGSSALEPEILKALQLQTIWKSEKGNLKNTATLFRQSGEDIIVNRGAAGRVDDPKYVNTGAFESEGLENELAWYQGSYQFFWNTSLSQALSAENYSLFDGQFAHAPSLTSNLIVIKNISDKFSTNLTLRYLGSMVYNQGSDSSPVKEEVDSTTLVNLGGRYQSETGFYFDTRIYNVLDTEHFLGGQSGTQIPYRQPGRWYLVSMGYEF